MSLRIHVRHAREADLPRLTELQRRFVEGHCGNAWKPRHLKTYLESVAPFDPQRLRDETLFVAGLGSRVVGFASWSYRERARRGQLWRAPRLAPRRNAARLEACYIEPEWLRGAGEHLIRVTEFAASQHGFERAELSCCPDGVGHYEALGYQIRSTGEIRLPGGDRLPSVRLERCIADREVPRLGRRVAAA